MNSSFPNRWSFSYLKFTKYVTNIIAEPKHKYGQQEQVTVRNHNRSTALDGLNGLKDAAENPADFMIGQIHPFQNHVTIKDDCVFNCLIEASEEYDTSVLTFWLLFCLLGTIHHRKVC